MTILKPAAGKIITWWSKVFMQCPPYATVLWFLYSTLKQIKPIWFFLQQINTPLSNIITLMFMHILTHMLRHMLTHMFAHVFKHVYTQVNTRVCTEIYNRFTFMFTRVYTHVYTHNCTHHIRTYLNTCLQTWFQKCLHTCSCLSYQTCTWILLA